MASTPREPTSTLPQSSRLPPVTTASPFHTTSDTYRPRSSDSPRSPTTLEPLKPSNPTTPKSYLTSKVELTGAAAMEENRRHDEELKKQNAPMTSPNPAKSLLGPPTENISRPSDAPPTSSSTSTSKPADALPPLTSQDPRTVVAEPMEIDEPENAPPMTSSPERTLPPSGTSDPNYRPNSKKRPASPTAAKNDERSNKSYTYPPPPEHEAIGGARNMSLPNAGTKSPSVKKHRCPHCDTEFTRHHNLKSHLLTHSHEKPYGCDQCSQRFRRLHDLKRHIKLHTGERPHTCTICGRKFARGDALARHNKGPGGCAGRRESGAGEDDEYSDLRGDEDMDDAYPLGDDENGDENDPGSDDRDRRRSEPNKRNRRSSARQDSTSNEYRQPSTYPPVAPALGGSRSGDMPPPSSGPSSRDPQHLSPWHAPPSFSSVQYNGPSSMYSQSGMTESPKPLSPGNSDPHHRNSDVRPRSPSLATKLQQQHFGRSTDSRTPPISLPPPVTSHQQLPSISGIDPRFGSGSTSQNTPPSGGRPPAISTHMGATTSGPSSESSQHQSSAGSSRDLHYLAQTSSQAPRPDEASLREYVRGVEMRLHEEKTARVSDREERDKIIRQQQDELEALRNELAHFQGRPAQPPQQPQLQQHRRSH